MPTFTRFVLKHKLLVIAFWLVLAVAGAMTATSTTKRLSNSFAMPGAAFRADARIQAHYLHNGAEDPVVPVITLPAGTSVNAPGVARRLDGAFAAARTVIPTARVVDYATTRDPAFVTRDGRSTYALVFTPQDNPMAPGNLDARIQQAVGAAVPASWQVSLTGIQALATSQPSGKGAGVLAEAMLGALGALVVLAFVFASFLALVPLVMAGISILTTFLALGGLTHITTVSQIVEFLIALIGLGVAIDYTLLVVTRWREERAHGRHGDDAVQAAMASAGRAVLFSGLTVGIGLLALVVLPVPFLRSAGIGGVLIPLISVAVALTLLPVLLGERRSAAGLAARAQREHRQPRLERLGAFGRPPPRARRPRRHRHPGRADHPRILDAHRRAQHRRAGPDRPRPHRAGHAARPAACPPGTLTPIDVLTRADAAPAVAHRLASVPGIHAAVAPATAGLPPRRHRAGHRAPQRRDQRHRRPGHRGRGPRRAGARPRRARHRRLGRRR